MNTQALSHSVSQSRLRAFASLCKLRVNSLIVFTAMVGMALAQPGWPAWRTFIAASVGIGLIACAAAAINCLIERTVDARMMRTRSRPLPAGDLAAGEALAMAIIVGALGMYVLHTWVNALTLWLSVATFLGYAVIYTVVLKPATPMNIVIGGAAGAMPPVLGWAAMTGTVGWEAISLFLIIFLWTPPHFWALCMARRADYKEAGFPMLPITHGIGHTCTQSVVYAWATAAASVLPVLLNMAGAIYLICAVLLGARFIYLTTALRAHYTDAASWQVFRFSIVYLSALFGALFLDRLVMPWLTL